MTKEQTGGIRQPESQVTIRQLMVMGAIHELNKHGAPMTTAALASEVGLPHTDICLAVQALTDKGMVYEVRSDIHGPFDSLCLTDAGCAFLGVKAKASVETSLRGILEAWDATVEEPGWADRLHGAIETARASLSGEN